MAFTPASTVFDKVIQAVKQTVFVEGQVLEPATRITDDLRLGRFGRLKLTLYLEEAFDTEISDEAVEQFNTVGDIIQYMSRGSHESAEALAGGVAGEPLGFSA